MSKIKRNGTKPQVLSAREAVEYIADQDTVAVSGAGGGIVDPYALINALHERYVETGCPKNLTLWHSTGLGDRNDRGMSPLALEGLVKRVIGGHWGQSPRLAEMASENKIEAYNFPQGIMAQLARTAAAGQPGILSHVGLGTFIDPRVSGGKLNEVSQEDLIMAVLSGCSVGCLPDTCNDCGYRRLCIHGGGNHLYRCSPACTGGSQ